MKANMIRKATSIKELEPKNEIVVEKCIILSKYDFEVFSNNLLDDYDFIKENIQDMYIDVSGVWHCLLVSYKGSNKAILVESEGYTYARYSAYIELNEDFVYRNVLNYPYLPKVLDKTNTPF